MLCGKSASLMCLLLGIDGCFSSGPPGQAESDHTDILAIESRRLRRQALKKTADDLRESQKRKEAAFQSRKDGWIHDDPRPALPKILLKTGEGVQRAPCGGQNEGPATGANLAGRDGNAKYTWSEYPCTMAGSRTEATAPTENR